MQFFMKLKEHLLKIIKENQDQVLCLTTRNLSKPLTMVIGVNYKVVLYPEKTKLYNILITLETKSPSKD